jgi:hypothetical protein
MVWQMQLAHDAEILPATRDYMTFEEASYPHN